MNIRDNNRISGITTGKAQKPKKTKKNKKQESSPEIKDTLKLSDNKGSTPSKPPVSSNKGSAPSKPPAGNHKGASPKSSKPLKDVHTKGSTPSGPPKIIHSKGTAPESNDWSSKPYTEIHTKGCVPSGNGYFNPQLELNPFANPMEWQMAAMNQVGFMTGNYIRNSMIQWRRTMRGF